MCHEALREFILETRDFAKLLGDIHANGTRIKGAIEQRLDLINLVDQQDFLKNITIQAAGVADDKGLITDAVLLYHLAENYDPVILGKNMIGLYNSNQMYFNKIRQINRDACGLLLRMMEAKMEVEAGRWAPALDHIDRLGVLPLQAQGSMSYIRSAAQAFSSFPEIISRNIGHVIMWSIACIGQERHKQVSGPYETDMHHGFAEQLLSMAKDLMVFSGMVKYKLPPKVYEALARAGADIGAY